MSLPVTRKVEQARVKLAALTEEKKLETAAIALCMMEDFKTTMEGVGDGLRVEFKFPKMFDTAISTNFDHRLLARMSLNMLNNTALHALQQSIERELNRRKGTDPEKDEENNDVN